jgi:hypothetical protein
LLLTTPVVTQERITDAPFTMLTGGRLPCLAADAVRKRLILAGAEGVFRYQIPANDGSNGVWDGPYGGSNWASTISGGLQNGVIGDWAGVIGTHRTDFNKTFIRHNLMRQWIGIQWND